MRQLLEIKQIYLVLRSERSERLEGSAIIHSQAPIGAPDVPPG